MRRAVLSLIALAAVLPSLAFARPQFLCDIDLIVRDACCCPAKRAKATTEATTEATTMQRECCEIVHRAATAAPVATVAGDAAAPAAIAVAIMVSAVAAPVRDERIAVIPRAQAPPPEHTLLSQSTALLL